MRTHPSFSLPLPRADRAVLAALARRRGCAPATLARALLGKALHEAVAAIDATPHAAPLSPPVRLLLIQLTDAAQPRPGWRGRRGAQLRAVDRYLRAVRAQPGGPTRQDEAIVRAILEVFTELLDKQSVREAIEELTRPGSAATGEKSE